MESIVHTQPPIREDVIATLRASEPQLRRRGVVHLALFGSIARGDAGPESDIDVVVDIEAGRKFSLIDLASLQAFLCDLLDRETDVLLFKNLRPASRARIDDDLVAVF